MFTVMVVAAVLVVVMACVVCALVIYTRRARRRLETADQARYAPSSADPRGRWQVSSFGPSLLEPAPYVLNTNQDPSRTWFLDPVEVHRWVP